MNKRVLPTLGIGLLAAGAAYVAWKNVEGRTRANLRGQVAQDLGNNIITLDDAETARWKEASRPTIDKWLADMQAAGADGQALYDAATAAVSAESGV